MADKKITQLTQHTSVINSDLLPVVDITATETKKLAVGTLRDFINTGLVSSTETGSFVTNDQTGSFYVSSSVSNDTITFFKGIPGTQHEVTVNNVSNAFTSTTASFAFTASAFHVTTTDEPVSNSIVFVNTNSGTVETQEAKIDYALSYNPSINQLTVPNLNVTTAFTSSLDEGYMWVGSSAGITEQIPTSSFVTPAQTGSFVESAYISLYSSASQALVASGSAQPVTFTSVWANKGITLESGSRLVMAEPGVYQFNFVAQVANNENAVFDSWFWIKYNGSNFPNSTTQMTLQARKNINLPSAQLMTMNIVGVNTVANGYIELYWTGEDLNTSLKETPAFGPIPETPSIIANIIRVG